MKSNKQPLSTEKKELIQEFLEIFNMDRAHDRAPIEAVLLKGQTKKEMKRLLMKKKFMISGMSLINYSANRIMVFPEAQSTYKTASLVSTSSVLKR